MNDRPITTEAWQGFDVMGTVDAGARIVVFGAFLAGVGTMWVDDIELAVEVAPGTWSPVPIANPGFEVADTLVGWSARSPGYEFAVTTERPAEGRRALRIAALPDTLSGRLFDARPAPGESIDRALGGGLRARIPLTLWSDSGRTLPRVAPDTLARLMSALETVRSAVVDPDDERTRLAAALIAWNVFEHFYPYFDVVKVDWEPQLDSALAGALAARDGAAFLHTLNRLVARLQDGHGRVWHPRYSPDGVLPIRMEWIEGQAMVTASADSLVRRGDAVVAIDGTPIQTLLRQAEDEISGSPQWKRWRATTECLARAGAARRSRSRSSVAAVGSASLPSADRGTLFRHRMSQRSPCWRPVSCMSISAARRGRRFDRSSTRSQAPEELCSTSVGTRPATILSSRTCSAHPTHRVGWESRASSIQTTSAPQGSSWRGGVCSPRRPTSPVGSCSSRMAGPSVTPSP